MNDQAPSGKTRIQAPPAPATLADTGLSMTIMRDILLKTMFRMSLNLGSDLARVLCLSFSQTQQLIFGEFSRLVATLVHALIIAGVRVA